MSYDIYRYIFIGSAILSIVMLLATIVIFFALNIKNVIGDLTGSNARKGIESIQNQSVTGVSGKKTETEKNNVQSPTVDTSSSAETSKIKLEDRYDNLSAAETTTLSVSAMPKRNGVEYSTESTVNKKSSPANPNFIIETDITYVHSDEIIGAM